MKKSLARRLAACVLTVAMLAGLASMPASASAPEKEYMNLAYIYGGNVENYDYSVVTHVNYSFGLIYNKEYTYAGNAKESWNTVDVNPELEHTVYVSEKAAADMDRINELKEEQNPDLKMLLSVGGWGARGFTDAAATAESRAKFAQSCKEMIDRFDLAGIDLDWEYPVNAGWGEIAGKPEDKQNFTLLLKEIRSVIGDDKLLTIAGGANDNFALTWTEFQEIYEILDFINVMTYDFHHETCYFGYGLYASQDWPTRDAVSEYNVDRVIHNYLNNGCPPEKLNVGYTTGAVNLPSALRDEASRWPILNAALRASGFSSDRTIDTNARVDKYLDGKTVEATVDGETYSVTFKKEWDARAALHTVVATIADNPDTKLFVMSYIDADGLDARADYIKRYNLGGSFFWQYGGDTNCVLTSHMAEVLDTKYDPVSKVVKSIDAIDTDNLTLEDADAVAAVRAAYEALTDEQKAQVANLDKLTAAEAALAELAKGEEPTKPADPDNSGTKSPDTGDNMPIVLPIAMIGAAIVNLLIKRRLCR